MDENLTFNLVKKMILYGFQDNFFFKLLIFKPRSGCHLKTYATLLKSYQVQPKIGEIRSGIIVYTDSRSNFCFEIMTRLKY